MPPVEEPMNQEHETMSNKPVIGIIYPPPEVRNIVDKTAGFVARNGPEFETRIRQNELNNPKFNFLTSTDPYHAYYQHKVKEFREGHGVEPAAPKPSLGLGLGISRPQQEQIKIAVEPVIPKEPPPENEFIADPPSISAFDLDVVKLTAQFVARNGRQFLTNLMNREKNYQFDFLRPQHSLFNYFTKLVEQYTKVLIPPKDLLPKLRKESDDPREVLDQVKYRVDWQKYQDMQRRKEEEALEKERVAYASIDWHDFVVVETVDFNSNEPGNFPPPTTPEEVGARLLAAERYVGSGPDQTVEMEVESSSEEEDEDEEESEEESEKEEEEDVPPPPPPQPAAAAPQPGSDTQVQDMEEDSDEEAEAPEPPRRAKSPPPPPLPPAPPAEKPQPLPPLPPNPEKVVIRDYNPKAPKAVSAALSGDKFQVSPITGEMIPVDKIPEHMRIGLLDPKWIEQRDRTIAERREQEEVFAAGSAIGGNLKLLAERRTDIFGSGAEEAQIGKKIGEEEKRTKEKVTWDGHTASMERVTQKARENISIEEQIAVIHKAKGLLPDEEKEKIGPAMPKSAPPLPRPPPPPPVSRPQPPQPPPPPQPPQQQPPVPPPPQPMMLPQRMMMMQPRPPMPPQMRQQHMMGMPRGPMPPMGHPMGMGPPGGFMPPGMHPPGMGHPGGPPGQMRPGPPMDDDGPLNKKAKTEDNLMPEQEFLRRNKGPVMFKVAIPAMPDKAEWKLNGQMLTFSLPITDSVSVIKAKLHEELGMPAGKQKLQYDGLFIKDSNTLAFYNFTRGAIVQLQLKERGGRKK